MIPLLVLVFLGPAETISGKYLQHSPEYRQLHPAPDRPLPVPLPTDVDPLCRLIEAGPWTPELFAALGEALLRNGKAALAYRAFHRAHRLRPQDAAWGRRMQARLARCPRVPAATIRDEEAEAAFWVARLQEYERDRIARGEDPADLTGFYERYGRPEDDLRAFSRARRLSWVGGVVGVLIGVALGAAAPRLRRRAAIFPLAVAALCFAGPALVGQTGLFWWGAGFALAGALLVLAFGRRRP
ncbi:MAG: hypothetical protein ACYTEZ_03990 [Planctomycetota bacterium]